MNTAEHLIVFIPGLWIFASYVSATVGAGLGLVFVIGHLVGAIMSLV